MKEIFNKRLKKFTSLTLVMIWTSMYLTPFICLIPAKGNDAYSDIIVESETQEEVTIPIETEPVIEETTEVVEIETETFTEEVETNPVEIETKPILGYSMSEEDINLIALIVMAEAEGESELGKRLVIDVILNRIDSKRFPNTATGVIYAQGQFTSVWNGRIDKCYASEDICRLVKEELVSRINSDILFFRADYYFKDYTPVIQEGNHYFSKY